MPLISYSIVSRPSVATPDTGLLPVVYEGEWDASANIPALVSGVGTKGFTYKVTTAGTTMLDGNNAWNVGDYVTFNGDVWDQLTGGALVAAGIVDASAAGRAMLTAANAAAQAALLTNVLKADATAQISAGYTLAPKDNGVFSTGTFTPNPALGNYQFLTNNGPFAIVPPANDCAMLIVVTNGAAAGAITLATPGWKVPASGSGDPYVLTAGFIFHLNIVRVNGVATYTWKALQ